MKKLVLIIVFAVLLITPCRAELVSNADIERAVPQSAEKVIGSAGVDDAINADRLIDKVWNGLKTSLLSGLRDSVGKAIGVFAVAVICGIFGVFSADGGVPDYVPLCGCAAIAVICAGDMNSFVKLGTQTLDDISVFSKSLLPALCASGAACGAVASSAAKFAASALFTDVLITAAKNLILPLIYAYLALVIASAAFDNKSLGGISKLAKWLCTFMMTVLTVGFTAYLSISSAIASSSDAVAMKVAKTTISTALPVVGGILSDAASSVVAGMALLRSSIGVFGLVVVLAICVVPFATLGVNYLMFKLAGVCTAALGNDRLADIVGGIGGAFGLLLGLVGSSGLMMFISILSCIRTVSG